MSLLEELESLRIPFGDIKEATKNFTTLIGKGGYGLVYRGELRLSGRLTTVAVKRLQVSISGQGFKEFLTEIQLLTRYKHPNLISLIGFCDQDDEKILIYEYAEHGSLDKYLSIAENRRTLTWMRRLNICVDAARGLNYLHNEAAVNERVIHRDIKSANVLLDQNWKAMISDLGLSKLGRANEKDTYLITNASGTYVYCDPVYTKSGILTKESDVYSFGVVLFEVLCGRLCVIDVHNEHRFLPQLAQSYYKKGQINEIMDPELQNELDPDSLKKFSEIAFKCIHNTRKQRPSMRWVLKKLEELEKTLDLQNDRKRKQHSSSGPANSTSTMMYGADETGGLASSVNRRLFLSPQTVPFQLTQAPVPTSLAGQMSNPPAISQISGSAIGLGGPSVPAELKHPRTQPMNPSLGLPSVDSEHVSKRTRPMSITDEVNNPVNMLPVAFQGDVSHSQAFDLSDDLPKTVARTLNQGSSPMSMDFHPIHQTLLLGLWEVRSRQKLVLRNFEVWDLGACSNPFQAAFVKDPFVSVNRVIWNPDGSLFGVAYSRHIVQIYSYHYSDDFRRHLEIEAHVGGVNDLAFSHPNKQLCVITCGDDKTIKVWDAVTGDKQYTFEGHDAPVYSVCPHQKENIQFIFSTDLDGKIKAWLYNNLGSRVDYKAPGRWCTTMAYSADGTRLFSCGTSKEGESHIVEWNESEGAVKRTYVGFRKRSLGVVQFDTTKNRFLAAGDDFSIKYWHMDNIRLLTSVDAGRGLPASPRIRFNRDGTLLAVSANDNGIKILSNSEGLRLLRTFENLSYDAASRAPEPSKPTINTISAAAAASSSGLAERVGSVGSISGVNGDSRSMADVKPRITEEPNDKSKIWILTEISESSQCRSLKLPENMRVTKISRLIYTNSGNAILALASNAIHLLWKWQRSERNSSGKATANVSPQLWQPSSGSLMTNDVAETNPEESVSCFALSKNDAYVISASGGKISLFNMMSFETMKTFMPPPPAATFLAFYPPNNNIIAIGMDDSSIQICNVRDVEVISKLEGHSKRITGLAFSFARNVLVSSGADSQLCVWSCDGWEKQKARYLQLPPGRAPTALSDTQVQFHNDQTHFLVVHETQLAIYETTKLECVKQWLPHESSAPMSHAMFSCDSQLVYASFLDATVCVFTASNLCLQCRINPSAYLPSNVPSNANVHPLVIATHPQEPNQFALGLSDGAVHVLEPTKSEGKWGGPTTS